MRVYWHEEALAHDTGAGMFDQPPTPLIEVPELHPENTERIRNIRSALTPRPDRAAAGVARRAATRRRPSSSSCTPPAYVRSVQAACAAGPGLITQSTPVVPASWGAALASAGTALAATEAVLAGETRRRLRARAAARPPRPAGPGRRLLPVLERGPLRRSSRAGAASSASPSSTGTSTTATAPRPASGSGPTSSPISLHMRHGSWGPHHPQTGAPGRARRRRRALGRNVNVELPVGTGDEGYRRAWRRVVEPVLAEFRPQLLVIACGQDASQYDPNGRMCVTHGRLPRPGRGGPRAGRAPLRRPPGARAGGRLRPHLLGLLHARDPRGRARHRPRSSTTRSPTCPTTPTGPTRRSPPSWRRSRRTGAGSRHDRRRAALRSASSPATWRRCARSPRRGRSAAPRPSSATSRRP